MTLFNPGLEEKVADAVHLPVVSAVSSAVAALSTFEMKSVLLMTPFDAASDGFIKRYLETIGFRVSLGQALRKPQTRIRCQLEPG